MVVFLRRLIGALVLDPGTYEDIESDRRAGMQSVAVVALACAAGGVGSMGLGLSGPVGVFTGAIVVLGAWLVWVGVVATIGTIALAEPETHSDRRELLRTLGFASAPALFLAFAAMPTAAPFVIALVLMWMIAAAVVGVRQALDYHSTMRAVAVCGLGLLVALGVMLAVSLVFSRQVS
jgi:hypothetical protein